jgi:hypothetical protein
MRNLMASGLLALTLALPGSAISAETTTFTLQDLAQKAAGETLSSRRAAPDAAVPDDRMLSRKTPGKDAILAAKTPQIPGFEAVRASKARHRERGDEASSPGSTAYGSRAGLDKENVLAK